MKVDYEVKRDSIRRKNYQEADTEAMFEKLDSRVVEEADCLFVKMGHSSIIAEMQNLCERKGTIEMKHE